MEIKEVEQCPLAHEVKYSNKLIDEANIVIEKAPAPSLWQKIVRFSARFFSYQTFINNYYFRDALKVYDYIEQCALQARHKKEGASVFSTITLVGEVVFVLDPTIIRAIVRYPRLEQGDFFSEGRQLRVIADGLGKIRLNAEHSDMKAKRSVLANLLANPERYLTKLFEITDKLAQKWLAHEETPFGIVDDLANYTVAMFLGPILNYSGPTAPIVAILEEQINLLGKRLVYRTPMHFSRRFKELRNELLQRLNPLAHQGTDTAQYDEHLSKYIDKYHKEREQEAYAIGLNSGTLAGYLAPYPAFVSAVYELGNHPMWQHKLCEEWQRAKAAGMTAETYIAAEDTLLHAVIHEVLRLHPSQPFLFRKAADDLSINSKFFIPKNAQIVLDLYHALREKDYWGQDAHLFNPMRFLNNPLLYKKAFLVYSSGVNNCTGQFYSRLELKVFVHILCSYFSWVTISKDVQHKFHFALTYNTDIVIQLKENQHCFQTAR